MGEGKGMFQIVLMILIMVIIVEQFNYINDLYRFGVILCTLWWVVVGNMAGMMPLITGALCMEMLQDWEITPS